LNLKKKDVHFSRVFPHFEAICSITTKKNVGRVRHACLKKQEKKLQGKGKKFLFIFLRETHFVKTVPPKATGLKIVRSQRNFGQN